MQALGAMRYDRAVQGLIDLFQYRGKGDLAESALDAIAHIAHPSSVPLLVAQLGSKDATLKGIAAEGLARVGDRGQLADLQTALGYRYATPASSLRAALRQRCCQRRAPRALLGSSRRSRIQGCASRRAGTSIEAAPGRTQAFARYLQDPDPLVRTTLVDALGLSDDTAAIALVQPMASDPDVQVARAVERALARLRQRETIAARTEETSLAVPFLRSARRSTWRAISSARSSFTCAEVFERAASSSRSRRTSASPIRPATPHQAPRVGTSRSTVLPATRTST